MTDTYLVDTIFAQETEIARLRVAIESAVHILDSQKVWGGMEWTYQMMAPFIYFRAIKKLRNALDSK